MCFKLKAIQGCALTAQIAWADQHLASGDRKYILGRPAGRPAGVGFLIYSQKENVVQLGARWYSKVVPREFTCNIIINFDCEKLHSFRF